jgi:hypothetical protein
VQVVQRVAAVAMPDGCVATQDVYQQCSDHYHCQSLDTVVDSGKRQITSSTSSENSCGKTDIMSEMIVEDNSDDDEDAVEVDASTVKLYWIQGKKDSNNDGHPIRRPRGSTFDRGVGLKQHRNSANTQRNSRVEPLSSSPLMSAELRSSNSPSRDIALSIDEDRGDSQFDSRLVSKQNSNRGSHTSTQRNSNSSVGSIPMSSGIVPFTSIAASNERLSISSNSANRASSITSSISSNSANRRSLSTSSAADESDSLPGAVPASKSVNLGQQTVVSSFESTQSKDEIPTGMHRFSVPLTLSAADLGI